MKRIFIVSVLFILSIGVYAETPKPEVVPVKEETNSSKIQDALYDLLVSMTNGVQDSGGAIKDGISGGVNLVKREVPLVLKEVIMYGRVKHPITIVFEVILLICMIQVLRKKVFKWEWNKWFENDSKYCGNIIGGVVTICALVGLCIISFCSIHTQILKTAKVYFAPRMYLIEYSVDLAKELNSKKK